LQKIKNVAVRPLLAGVLALAMVGGFATYEFVRPQDAHAAIAAPPAAALDADSVGALLAYDKAMETLTARVTPAVVNVAVTSRSKAQAASMDGEDMQQFFGQFFGQQIPRQFRQQPRERVEHDIGSGVVISPDGYIVTNNHVVEGATDIRVTTTDRRVLKAKLIGTDPLTDLAVIKVEGKNLASVPWGDSTMLHPGQTVLAFGNPFGMRFSVTRGIVSALNRSNPYNDDPRKPGEFIQTDAAINQGNSGGPLVDARGAVVGINTFLISPSGAFSGMGFAIPAQIAKPTVDTLIRDGKIEHSYMGVLVTDVTPENAKFFHVNEPTGAVISQVESDSPGARAGLKIGDVITQVDGKTVESSGQLQVLIGSQHPGSKANLTVMRDGKPMNVTVTLESMNKKSDETASANEPRGKARWGIGLSDLTPDLKQQLDAPKDLRGAVVGRVEPGSPADNAGLSQGDVILQVNRQDTTSAAEVKDALAKVPAGQDALLLIWSQGGNSFRVMHGADASGS
jgi:serine protease Do